MNTIFYRSVRLPLILLTLLIGVIASVVLIWPSRLLPANAAWRMQAYIVRMWARLMGLAIGLKVETAGARIGEPMLMVANHISWVDIIGLLGMTDAVFIAKAEVRRWPLIGWLCHMAGTVFIARGEAGAVDRTLDQMVAVLKRGRPVFFFPEGTTTDGHAVRHFFPHLFSAAITAGVAVQPVALHYPAHTGNSLSSRVPFIDDDTFERHLWRLIGAPSIRAHYAFCSRIESSGTTRRTLSRRAHASIVESLERDVDHHQCEKRSTWKNPASEEQRRSIHNA